MNIFPIASAEAVILDWLKGPGLYILLVGAGAFLLARILKVALHRTESHMVSPAEGDVPSEREKRAKAVSGIVGNLLSVVIYLIALVAILDRLGVRTASIIASIGVVGVALGLGAQSLARDFISGVFILAEGQFGVGDVIKIQATGGTVTGTVERITLRTTILRGTNGESQLVPNGEIRIVSNLSKEWARAVLDLPVSPADVEAAQDAARAVGEALSSDPDWSPLLLGEPEVLGVETLSKDEATIRFRVATLPLKQWEVSREVRRRVLEEFAKRGIVGGRISGASYLE